MKPVVRRMACPNQATVDAYQNLLNASREYELGLLVAHGVGTTCSGVQVLLYQNQYIMDNYLIIGVSAISSLVGYCIDSSYSFIQLLPFNTSRGRVPSGGPTMPSFSMMSIKCAARP
jgi:hypothetical protein